jgi:hypothetical protein
MPYEPVVNPARTREGRLVQYIDALIEYEYDTFTIKDLHFHGSIWSTANIVIREAGLISIEEVRPNRMRYRIVASNDKLRDWIEDRQKR